MTAAATSPNHVPLFLRLVDGTARWRGAERSELSSPTDAHRTICRVFSLDPATYWFDLPDSFYGAGGRRVGHSSGDGRSRRIEGMVFDKPKGSDPCGRLYVLRREDKFSEHDDDDPREFFREGGL